MHDFDIDRGTAPRRRASERPAPSDYEGGRDFAATRPASDATASLLHLQRTAGNTGVVQMLRDDEATSASVSSVQRESAPEEEEPLQG